MSWFTTIKTDIDSFLARQVAPAETEVIAAFRGILPVLHVALPMIETAAGMSAGAKDIASQVVVTAQAVLSRLSGTATITDIDSAFAAVSALATVLPSTVEPEVLVAIGFAQSIYAQFKSGVVVTPVAPPAVTGGSTPVSPSATVTASA